MTCARSSPRGSRSRSRRRWRPTPTGRRAVAAGERVLVVPVATSPTSRRRRGDDPVGDLARAAVERVRTADAVALAVVPVLVHVRRVADQARLGREARRDNLAGALGVAPWGRALVRGSVCVVADDVVTTGSTVAEAARALRAAGARHVVAAAVAATPRWSRAPPSDAGAAARARARPGIRPSPCGSVDRRLASMHESPRSSGGGAPDVRAALSQAASTSTRRTTWTSSSPDGT